MAAVYASMDLGGTNIKAVLAGPDGKVLVSKSVPTEAHEGPDAVLSRMATLMASLQDEAGAKPEALGMGVPGLADVANGVTKFLPNLPTQWRDVPVAETLGGRLGHPVYLLNDVRMATLGELTFGHGKTANTMAFFAVGTGIGGGLVVDGKLRLGPLGAAGELGHLTIVPDGPRCGCGNYGCMEALASATAMTAEGVRLMLIGLAPELHKSTGGNADAVTTKAMSEAAAAGDDAIKEALVRAARYLGIGVANVVTALHPDLIVIGGGAAGIGDLLFDTVRETVRERVKMFPTDAIGIKPSLLGDQAGALGGIALAMKGGLTPP